MSKHIPVEVPISPCIPIVVTGGDEEGVCGVDLVGDLAGDLVGDLTGDWTGDLTGDPTGDRTGKLGAYVVETEGGISNVKGARSDSLLRYEMFTDMFEAGAILGV
jgi:hypothetical protein